jgi:transcription-repair coupling factor (superfamily II helicase)
LTLRPKRGQHYLEMAIDKVWECLEENSPIVVDALPPAGLSYLLARAPRHTPYWVISPTMERCEQIARDLKSLGVQDVEVFWAENQNPFSASTANPEFTFLQCRLRHKLLQEESASNNRPHILVTPAVVLQNRWICDEDFKAHTRLWQKGDESGPDTLMEHLLLCGYNRVSWVDDPGTFAMRGGLVDIFPPGQLQPLRLDFFGDELTSIKTFDPQTRRTQTKRDMLDIYPIRDVLFRPDGITRAHAGLQALAQELHVPSSKMKEIKNAISDHHYFYGIERLWPLFWPQSQVLWRSLCTPQTRIVLDDPQRIQSCLAKRYEQAHHDRLQALNRHEVVLPVEHLLANHDQAWQALQASPMLMAQPWLESSQKGGITRRLDSLDALRRELEHRRRDSSRGEILDPVIEHLSTEKKAGHEVYFLCSSLGQAQRLRELLRGRDIDIPILEHLDNPLNFDNPGRSARWGIVVASLSGGFTDTDVGVCFLTDGDIFGLTPRPLARRRRKAASKDGLHTLQELCQDDKVIHIDHGIGCYLGLKRLTLDGVDGDYAHLEYADQDKLYLPIYKLNLLQRYRGPKNVKLDKLGGNRWQNTKQRVKDRVLAIAHQLLATQAKRKSLPGCAFKNPSEHFRTFEATFGFEETQDQQKAIDAVLADLCQPHPMDRLVCGDVGFGKTEVAIRAAFLTILSGKQVAVLVPTTVLAEQHGTTFTQRLAAEPVRVEVLNRFRKRQEVQSIIQDLRANKIDILIGTHRILSSDVRFEDLGLLVVDEEQRFGVRHKERIKELKSQVHVLTLSATPIPRTLNMAMVGMRDLSVINTPPVARLPIRTEVAPFNEELITEAIRRELRRGGQVFFVHNRVESIEAIANLLSTCVPEAQIAVAHGQMSGNKLEKIMVDFIQHRSQVLVCTAIIESGLDISSANTMLVNRADTFGLSQLHQLRGRIGRGRVRAYAYLLLPRSKRITPEATRRIAALKRFSDLGAGFQIASEDLELRGAGDLLGSDQSGSIAAVGFELYTELLNQAIERAKGERARNDVEPEIKIPVSAVLPEDYIRDPRQRMLAYQRFATAKSDAEIYDLKEEIAEDYGQLPQEVADLAELMTIRRRLKTLGVFALAAAAKDKAINLGLTFLEDAPIDRDLLAKQITQEPEHYRLLPSGRLKVSAPTLSPTSSPALLERVKLELDELLKLCYGEPQALKHI